MKFPEDLIIDMPIEDRSHGIIKVIGVGGGGSNAVNNMYKEGCEGVNFAVCNTDSQALTNVAVPVRVQLGQEGLGVGGHPDVGRQKAEESLDKIAALLDDGTQMVFITAGMGGGTGTGAAPVIAREARKRGILTVAVVTLPFAFEKRKHLEKALFGVEELRQYVDALLVINNERLMEVYADGITTIEQAMSMADNVLTTATRSIAEIITRSGTINCDFCDVKSVMQNGGSAIISVGEGEGDHRLFKAVNAALNSPLLAGVEIEEAQKMMCIVYSGQTNPVKISEMTDIEDFMESLSPDLEVFFGLYNDDTLGEGVKVSIVATGFDRTSLVLDPEATREDRMETLRDHYYGTTRREVQERTHGQNTDELLAGDGYTSAGGSGNMSAEGEGYTSAEDNVDVIDVKADDETSNIDLDDDSSDFDLDDDSSEFDLDDDSTDDESHDRTSANPSFSSNMRSWRDRLARIITDIVSED